MPLDHYGATECIECGTYSARLMAPRIPHICSRCLFPPAQAPNENRMNEMPTESRKRGRDLDRDLLSRLPNPGPAWRQ